MTHQTAWKPACTSPFWPHGNNNVTTFKMHDDLTCTLEWSTSQKKLIFSTSYHMRLFWAGFQPTVSSMETPGEIIFRDNSSLKNLICHHYFLMPFLGFENKKFNFLHFLVVHWNSWSPFLLFCPLDNGGWQNWMGPSLYWLLEGVYYSLRKKVPSVSLVISLIMIWALRVAAWLENQGQFIWWIVNAIPSWLFPLISHSF